MGRSVNWLDAFYRRHYAGLCASIRGSFGSSPTEPEDAVQSAFAKLAAIEDPSKINNIRAYLFVTARNIVLDRKRSMKVANAYLAEQIACDIGLKLEEITPERVVVARERFKLLSAALLSLSSKQQKILIMSRIEGKSYREISAETGWSAGDISRNMNAGMSILVLSLQRSSIRSTEEKQGDEREAALHTGIRVDGDN